MAEAAAAGNQGDQSSFDGGSQSQGGSGSQQGSGSQANQANQTNQSNQGSGTQNTPTRPEYVLEAEFDAKTGKVDDKAVATRVNAIIAANAAAESQRLARPQTADAYKVELPSDFKPPEGVKFEFNQADPLLAQARAVAHAEGLSQAGFSKLLALYAGAQVSTEQTIATARNSEIAKLGATGPARFTAIETWLKAQVGEQGGKQIASRIFTASDVELFEKLLVKATTQGGSTYKATGREGPEMPGRRSAEEVGKMSPRERLDYSRSFDQSKMPEWRDPRAA